MAPNTVEPSSYGDVLPTTIAKGDDVLNAAAKAGHKVARIYGYAESADHNNRRCIDFMHYGDAAMRDWLVEYVRADATRLGVCGIISNGRVIGFPSNGSAYRGPEGEWRVYTGPNPHTDHVHVEFNSAAISGPAPTPPPPPAKPRVSLRNVIDAARRDAPAAGTPKSHASETLIVERALVAEQLLEARWADGSFGTKTIAAYAAYQRRLGYRGKDADGIPGHASLTALGGRHGFEVVA